MENGKVAASGRCRCRCVRIIHLFLFIIAIGFVLHLSAYTQLSLPFLSKASTKKPKLWELPTLLNLTNFTWLMNNPGICQLQENEENSRLMPILVHTARANFEQREAIRRSYGSLGQYKNWTIRLVFLLGQADPELYEDSILLEETRLLLEQVKHGDLVMGSFVDTYRNLTHKHLMGYKWILNFCREADLILKTDDDMFVDILKWLDWRSADLEDKMNKTMAPPPPDLYCHLFINPWPVRDRRSKYYVGEEEWPGKRFPDYCSGWAYALTVDLIRRLYEATERVEYFRIDDVYVTGILLEEVKKGVEVGFRPRIRRTWGERTLNPYEYRGFCHRGRVEEKRGFKAVVYVPRDDVYGRMMDCLWNKTMFDHEVASKAKSNYTGDFNYRV